jgi:hypothetical protein
MWLQLQVKLIQFILPNFLLNICKFLNLAPSFFPPRFVHPLDKNDISAQVRMAAQCCHLTNVLITQSVNLWMVPQRLINEAKKINKSGHVG